MATRVTRHPNRSGKKMKGRKEPSKTKFSLELWVGMYGSTIIKTEERGKSKGTRQVMPDGAGSWDTQKTCNKHTGKSSLRKRQL